MTHFNNAIAAYRMHIRCKVDPTLGDAENYYKLSRHFARAYAQETGTTQFSVMMDVIDHHVANPIYS